MLSGPEVAEAMNPPEVNDVRRTSRLAISDQGGLIEDRIVVSTPESYHHTVQGRSGGKKNGSARRAASRHVKTRGLWIPVGHGAWLCAEALVKLDSSATARNAL
jgi:hypothetical protein